MKNIKIYISALFLLLLLSIALFSCDDDDTEDISRVTYYAILELQGGQFMSIPVNSTFIDPSCIGTLKGSTVQLDETGTVDATTPGVYRIDYAYTNSDGFAASTFRYVGVIDAAAAAQDLSGTFLRTMYGPNPGGDIAYWTKVSDGFKRQCWRRYQNYKRWTFRI